MKIENSHIRPIFADNEAATARNTMQCTKSGNWASMSYLGVQTLCFSKSHLIDSAHVTLWCRRVFVCSSFKLACTKLSLNLYC